MSLKAENIKFRYSSKTDWVLDGVSAEVAPEERVALTAPSGFGKTTLCKILAGYLPSENVSVDGQPLPTSGYSPVQMIWQHPEAAVNPRLPLGKSVHEAGRVEQRVLDELGIQQSWLRRRPAELSGGEIQRCCIARALGPDTKYLIADEITTMLDTISQATIWQFLINEVEKRKIGLLIVSHDKPLVKRLATRVIKLD